LEISPKILPAHGILVREVDYFGTGSDGHSINKKAGKWAAGRVFGDISNCANNLIIMVMEIKCESERERERALSHSHNRTEKLPPDLILIPISTQLTR